MDNQEIKELLEKNLAATQEVLALSHKIKKYMFMAQMWAWVQFALIVIPLIAGIVLLPSLLKNVFSGYQDLLPAGSAANPINSLEGLIKK